MRTTVPAILLSGLALLLYACTNKDAKNTQELLIDTTKVTTLPQDGYKEFPFISRPFRTSELSFRVGGPIDRFDVYAGNQYKQGSIIAEINPRDFHIRKERAEAVYRQSKTEFERIEALYQKGNISASTYEKAKADYISAKATFNTAVCELEDTRLTAPFSGYVGEVYIEKYQDVKATQPVISFIDIHQLRIEIYIPQEIAYTTQSLDNIQIHFDAIPDKTYQAKIIEVSKGTTRNNLSYLLTAILPNEGGKLLAGMSGKAMLNIPQAESVAGLCISQAALCHRPSIGDYVWVVNPVTAQVSRRKVTVRKLLPNGLVQISDGLQIGETLATSSLRFLSDGMKVSITTKSKQS